MRKQNSRTVDKEGVVWKCADFGAVFVSLSPIQPQNLHASAQLLPYKLSCPAPPPYTSNNTSVSQIAGQWIRKELCGSAQILGLSSSPSPASNPKICTLPHNSFLINCPVPPPPYTSNNTSFSQIAGQWIRKELCGSAQILGLSSSPSPTSNPKICTLPHNSILINCPVPHHHRTRPTPLPPTTCHESFGWRRSHFFWHFSSLTAVYFVLLLFQD